VSLIDARLPRAVAYISASLIVSANSICGLVNMTGERSGMESKAIGSWTDRRINRSSYSHDDWTTSLDSVKGLRYVVDPRCVTSWIQQAAKSSVNWAVKVLRMCWWASCSNWGQIACHIEGE
jgi:hypothetical protein